MIPHFPCVRIARALVLTPALSLLAAIHAEVVIDGLRQEDEGYGALVVQETTSNWGDGNVLANLSAVQQGSQLHVFVGGSAQNNAIILFIDSKPGGQTFLPNTLITQGGEEYTINNLGSSESAGLAFEEGFAADYAVRLYGAGADAHVNLYNFANRNRVYAGEAGGNNLSSGFIVDMFVSWQPVPAGEYADHAAGAELALSLPLLGVPTGTHVVKMVAALVNGGSDYGSNQFLGSRTSGTNDLAGEIRSFSFEAEPGTQTFSITVENNDSDGDGIPDATDPDDDNDGLEDAVETGTGVYVSPTNTGSDPLNKDSDADGLLDGAEVSGTALGYASNPVVPNFTAMTVPGTFNLPAAWTPASGSSDPSVDMTQGDTASLVTQYQWSLQYRFGSAGPIQYKFAAGSWTSNWGAGATPGSALPGATANFSANIAASGVHRFTFDQLTLTHSLERLSFADAASFLGAYGVSAGADDDGDSLANEAEHAANTDPTNPDTDGDGLSDAVETGTGVFAGPTNTGTNPLRSDTDGDGITDGVETHTGTFVDATNTGTNPHLADTDGDGESDSTEVFHGTDPTKNSSSLAAAGLPQIDGLRDGIYGPALAVQTVETSFGDNSNEWNAAYGVLGSNQLSLFFAGNLGDNFNKLELFLDTAPGGSTVFASAGNDGSGFLNGMTFDADFAPEYHLIIRRGVDGGNGKFDVDFADLVAAAASFHASVFGAANSGWGATGTGVNSQPILVAYNGTNSAGIGGNGGAPANQTAAAAVATGLEIRLQLADLGNPAGPVRVMALQANDSHSLVSNQALAGLPVGTGNLGNPATIDFSALEGDQYFTVTPTAVSPSFEIVGVAYMAASEQLQLTVSGLVPGSRYTIVQSPTLSTPFDEEPGSTFSASSTTQSITVPATTKPANFFKVAHQP